MARIFFAVYNQQFDRDPGIDQGRLSINSIDTDENVGFTELILVASSSTANRQGPEGFNQRGGIIPPHYRVTELARGNGRSEAWTLETLRQTRTTPGIEGACYQIFPVAVTTDKGVARSEFFVHEDKNVPGSLGCIVMDARRFASFEQRMKDLRDAGVRSLPLFIFYS